VFICLSARYLKTDAATITKHHRKTFHRKSSKFIYFGIKRSKIKFTRHKKQCQRVFLHSCECWPLLFHLLRFCRVSLFDYCWMPYRTELEPGHWVTGLLGQQFWPCHCVRPTVWVSYTHLLLHFLQCCFIWRRPTTQIYYFLSVLYNFIRCESIHNHSPGLYAPYKKRPPQFFAYVACGWRTPTMYDNSMKL